MSRTDHVCEKVREELEKSRVWLDRMPGVRSINLDIKFVETSGAVRVIIIKTESESSR